MSKAKGPRGYALDKSDRVAGLLMDGSGTLSQTRAALAQGRRLFVLDS